MKQEEQNITAENDTMQAKNDYTIALNKTMLYISICSLFGVICAVLSILTTRSIASPNGGIVYAFFVSILIVALTVKYFKMFGIITAFISSILFCFALNTSLIDSIINVSINTLQALLIFVAYRLIKKHKFDKQKNKLYNNIFAIIQFIIGLIFTCVEFTQSDTILSLRIIAIVEIIIFIIFSFIQKTVNYSFFLFLLCFLPSFISGFLNGCLQLSENWTGKFKTMETWTLSNFILLGSFGFVFIEQIRPEYIEKTLSFGEVNIKFTTLIYFAAVFLWNAIFFIIYYVGWLGKNLLPYVLPWLVGNMFLLANLYFNSHAEVTGDKQTNAFKWYEDRAVVAEKNTQFLISIITFLLPISSSLFDRNLSVGIITIFCINITCACLSIGLIWIPNKEIKAMSLIKTLKTVFHLLTVSFLLLSATMIIVPNYS